MFSYLNEANQPLVYSSVTSSSNILLSLLYFHIILSPEAQMLQLLRQYNKASNKCYLKKIVCVNFPRDHPANFLKNFTFSLPLIKAVVSMRICRYFKLPCNVNTNLSSSKSPHCHTCSGMKEPKMHT